MEEDEIRDRIKRLDSVRDSLSEHWSYSPSIELDAKKSDYFYKIHVARMKTIYQRPKPKPETAKVKIEKSLGCQLYGYNGLHSQLPEYGSRNARREKGWNDDFVHVDPSIEISNSDPGNKLRPLSAKGPSTNTSSRPSSAFSTKSRSGQSQQHPQHRSQSRENSVRGSSPSPVPRPISRGTSKKALGHLKGSFNTSMKSLISIRSGAASPIENRTMSPGHRKPGFKELLQDDKYERIEDSRREAYAGLTNMDALLLGCYRLDSKQKQIYQDFVDMLTCFDKHDMMNIVEDAVSDAHAALVWDEYTGIEG
jgi:hypothetical protein